MPATRSKKRFISEPHFTHAKASSKGYKVKLFNVLQLPIELRQRIYFFALAQETMIDNEVLRAYLSLGRFKINPLLPPLANVNEVIRVEAFQPFTQANTVELGALNKSTVQRWRNFVRHYGLDWNIARNVHSAAIDLRNRRTVEQWASKLSTNYVKISKFNFIRNLTIYLPTGHYGYKTGARQIFESFLEFDLPKLTQLQRVRIFDEFSNGGFVGKYTDKWWLRTEIGKILGPHVMKDINSQVR